MYPKMRLVLMADDDADDCMLAKEAFAEAAAEAMVHCVGDGLMLMEHLRNTKNLPSLILLDLNMPRKDGRQALKEIKSTRILRDIPIVIFTTSSEPKDIVFGREMGVSSFVTKPVQFSEWVDIMKRLTQAYVCGENPFDGSPEQ